MKKVFLVAHVIICVLLIAWKFTSLLQVYCTKLSLLLKNTSENMLPKTAPPTANEVNNNNLEKKIGNMFYGLFRAKIPVLNVVSTKHRSHFLPNSSSLDLLGAILNPVRACGIFAQSSRMRTRKYPLRCRMCPLSFSLEPSCRR